MNEKEQSNLAKRFEGFDLDAYYVADGCPVEIDWSLPVGEEIIADQ